MIDHEAVARLLVEMLDHNVKSFSPDQLAALRWMKDSVAKFAENDDIQSKLTTYQRRVLEEYLEGLDRTIVFGELYTSAVLAKFIHLLDKELKK